jgi:hypothetical protein
MLFERLTKSLREAFPDVPFVFAEPPEPVATLEGPCEEMSPLKVFDDGNEATIWLGIVTHGHFANYEEGITEDLRHQYIAVDVVEFVRDLIADRVVGMSSLGGRVGGWRRLEPGEPLPDRSRWKKQYVWSGALQ